MGLGSNGNGNGWHDSRLDLSTKVAIVTGGAGGIGRATAIELAREGIKAVAVVDFSENTEAFVAEANKRLKRDVMVPFSGDLTDTAFRKPVFQTMEQKFGPVAFCVPAAGITRDKLGVKINKDTGAAEIYSESDFRRVVE